ncbi:hypothetical protein WN944_008393 [Citrus x changshan-huyou]|uniref:Uncharacterized protein n=1 Tax=Citrus x changshan-huyou TaxID=2935761 RepID=A0AAP0MQ43_9ROSI
MAKNKRTAPSLRPALKNGAWGYWHAAMASLDSARMELYQDMTKANYDAKAASDGAVFCETWLNRAYNSRAYSSSAYTNRAFG